MISNSLITRYKPTHLSGSGYKGSIGESILMISMYSVHLTMPQLDRPYFWRCTYPFATQIVNGPQKLTEVTMPRPGFENLAGFKLDKMH